MAPRAPETKEAFFARLRQALSEGSGQIRFGAPHHTHVVCPDGDLLRVHRLTLDPARVEAYRAEHSSFMPEHAEMLSEPGDLVLEAASLDELISTLGQRWPL